jgi:predicted negative regulator of RcsB-dependent stress response
MAMAKTEAATGAAFDERTESAMDWVRSNGKYIAIAAVVVAVSAAGWFFVRQSQLTKATAAENQLNRARQSYGQGNLPLAQTDLRQVITRFKGTTAGSQATMLLAQTYFEQGKADSGLTVLNAGDPARADAAAFEALKGAGLEQKKEYAQAAARYQAAAAETNVKVSRDRYMADAARAFTSAGNKAEAAKIWETLAKDEASAFSAEARVRLGELTATAATR